MTVERRLDTARELGAINVELKSMKASIDTLTTKVEEFTAAKHEMKGAVRMARFIGAAVVAAFSGLLYLIHKLGNLPFLK